MQIIQTGEYQNTGYYNYWKDLRPLVNKQATNAFWNNSNLNYTKSVML